MRPVGNNDPSCKAKRENPVRSVPDGHFLFRRAVDLGSDPRTKQPTVAGDMVNKSVSGDLLRKWHAGDNIHALPAFTYVVAPGHPSLTRKPRSCDVPAGTKLCLQPSVGIFLPLLHIFIYSCTRSVRVLLCLSSSVYIRHSLSQSRVNTSHWK